MTDTGLNQRQRDLTATATIANRFLWLLLLAEVGLVAATWPLWTTIDRFPAVPLLTMFCNVPVMVDQCCTAVLCLASLVSCVAIIRQRSPESASPSNARSFVRSCLMMALLSGCVLVLLNQHRLQPWHWLFLLITVQTLLLKGECRTALYRLTIASIYMFAAASRWGPDVDSGMSRQVLTVLTNAIGAESLLRNPSFVFGGCLAMSAVEFLTGVLLLTPRLRRFGVAAAIGMHAALIFALSPWGLHHHLGVLVWNAFLLLAVPVLFAADGSVGHQFRSVVGNKRAKVLATFVLLFPLSGLFGVADSWLSWQVYSPRPEVVRVYVHEEFLDDLPSDLRPYVGQPAPLDVWCPVRIDQWSLKAATVPMYPEDRFQLAVARQIFDIVDDTNAIKVQIDEPQLQPWRKHRTDTIDRAAFQDRASGFLLNGNRVRSEGWRTTP